MYFSLFLLYNMILFCTLRNNNARYSDIFVEEYVSETLINDTDLLVS